MKSSQLTNIIKECIKEVFSKRESVFNDKKSWSVAVKDSYPSAKLKKDGIDLVASVNGNNVATWREEVGEGWVKNSVKENEFDGRKMPKHNAKVSDEDMEEAKVVASKIWQPVYLTRFHSTSLDGKHKFFEVLLHSATGDRHWMYMDENGKWFYSKGSGAASKYVSADEYLTEEREEAFYRDASDRESMASDVKRRLDAIDKAGLKDEYDTLMDGIFDLYIADFDKRAAQIQQLEDKALGLVGLKENSKFLKEAKNLDVFKRHQLKIALQTLKMNDAGASIMGGMDKDEARKFLKSIGYADWQIRKLEGELFEMSTTGGVAGYNIPGAFTRKGQAPAKKAMDVTKRMGYTPVKKEYK